MRQRLTVSFVVLSVALLLLALGIRAYPATDVLRAHESRDLDREVEYLALVVAQRVELGEPVDRSFLEGVAGPGLQVSLETTGGSTVVADGAGYGDGGDEPLVVRADVPGGGTLTLSESTEEVESLLADQQGSLWLLVLLVALVAGLVGYLMAWLVARPFQQLAVAADALGRGRFDLDLPRTRIPEARAMREALLTSAGQLQERLASEQAFAEHASHVLRSPLTALRLELDDLVQREDLPRDVRESAARSVGRVEVMDQLAGDLVALSRRGALVAGAEIPVRDLATQCAQVWADALAQQDRELTAAVEGDLEMTYTPGPVEHILDLLLTDVLGRGLGAVRLVFDADSDGHLAIEIRSTGSRDGVPDPSVEVSLTQARAVATALGGRLTGDDPTSMSVLLPRR